MSVPATGLHEAASDTRLAAGWSRVRAPDAMLTWWREGDTLTTRAWRLLANDGHAQALVQCVRQQVLGTGLWLLPQYQRDLDPASDDQERQARRVIRRALERGSAGTRLDAGNALTRVQLLAQLLLSGWVAGEGIAIRTWAPNRPGCGGWGTCWRVIDTQRVETPPDYATDAQVINGIRVDADGRKLGLYVRRLVAPVARSTTAPTWDWVPWFDDQGEPLVIHYIPRPDRAGTLRGLSPLAPVMLSLYQLAEATRAHVAGKRQQAGMPMSVPSDDPAADAAAYEAARQAGMVDDAVSVLFYQRGAGEPSFPTVSYQGADFGAFQESLARVIDASWGYPWQVVLAQLTNGNLASSQAALDQTERVAASDQDTFIAQAVQPLDRSILREAHASGWLGDLPGDLDRLAAGDYERPRRPDANRLRTRQAANEARKLGVSPTTIHAEMGYNFEDETRQTAADLAFALSQGVVLGDGSGNDPGATIDPAGDPNPPGQEPPP